jgi:hypothetical protein
MGVRGGLERADYWREVIREQEASGLSIAGFCRQRGVGQASFYNWRAKLRQQDDPANRQAAKFFPIELSAMPSGQGAMDHPATTPAMISKYCCATGEGSVCQRALIRRHFAICWMCWRSCRAELLASDPRVSVS